MNLTSISTRALGSVELLAKKHGASVLTGVGVTGFVATTVLVGRAVLKARPVVSSIKEETEEIAAKEITSDYTKRDQAQEMGRMYLGASGELFKIYGPAIAVGLGSIFCVIAAHGMMIRKQASLLAAYTTLEGGFKAYRARIREELGEEKELEVYRGSRKKEIEVADGVVVTSEFQDLIPSPYARFFDESNPNWRKNAEYNLLFLHSQQKWANDRLAANGFLFLNEVYEALGLERTQAGQVVGWKRKKPGEEGYGNGDGFVDFGLYDINNEVSRAFINGYEKVVLMDFNVDGPIAI